MGIWSYSLIISILAIVLVLEISSPLAEGVEYSPLPMVKLKSIPNQNDFLSSTQDEILNDVWHSTFVRDNGEKIELYLLYSGTRIAEFVAIFYFEDKTDDNFLENYYYQTDLFVLELVPDFDEETELGIFGKRFSTRNCVETVTYESDFYYLETADCDAGAVITKETENGWAAYVKLFFEINPPSQENPYNLKWYYVDARELNEDGVDESEFFSWPKFYLWHGNAYPTNESTQKLVVNSGRIGINDFLYMPTEILTEGLNPNIFDCADDSIEIFADQEFYETDEVAQITAKINSRSIATPVFLTIYDVNENIILRKSTKTSGADAIFLIDFKDFLPGIYSATVEYGINGAKDQVRFGVGPLRPFEQIEKEACEIYLLYDDTSRTLTVLGTIYDPSGSSIDGFDLFFDKNGDGDLNLNEDDIRFFVDKNNFGGLKIEANEGWLTNEEGIDHYEARINKVSDGYEFILEIPNISKNFRFSAEQSDYTFVDFKKQRFPSNSFSTIPISWLEPEFIDSAPQFYKADKWIPGEMIVEQDVDVNLILVGDSWTDSQKNEIKNNLVKSFSPLVFSELHLAGMKYNYKYNFISASDSISEDLFDLMTNNAEHINPFFGENKYDNPWGIATWVKNNHTEWVSTIQQRYEIDYKLIDANLVEKFLYENLISADSNLNKPNSANLVFIADDMNKIDFIHNYKLNTFDPSTDKPHTALGLMGYGGNYNLYFFDLYAVPWDDWQGFDFLYDPNLINEYTNFHDFKTEKEQNQLITNYINNATSLIITPSYLYPPVYKDAYVIDLLIVTEPSSTANEVLIVHFIDEDKIKSELQKIIPHSSWELQLTLERITSQDLPENVKKVLGSAKNIPLFSEEFGPTISVLDSEKVTEQLVNWATTRESSQFQDFTDVKKSKWIIPVVVMIGERGNVLYIDRYGVVGISPSHPEDETQPCCALALSNDEFVWDDRVGVTDLVIHEIGHTIGLMHPFQGFDPNYERIQNNYFNWYASAMTYNTAPRGCGLWYHYYVEGSCGKADSHFTEFEKNSISRGITTFLIKSAKNNVYRTILELEKDGTDPNNLPIDVENQIKSIEEKITKASTSFALNNLHGDKGALKTALAAAIESQDLAEVYEIAYKTFTKSAMLIEIPNWIKSQVGWWVSSETQDSDFINSMQYLIKERIIVLPSIPESSSTGEVTEIPPWIKNTAGWWSQGQVSDKEFVAAMQFLIKEGIIRV